METNAFEASEACTARGHTQFSFSINPREKRIRNGSIGSSLMAPLFKKTEQVTQADLSENIQTNLHQEVSEIIQTEH